MRCVCVCVYVGANSFAGVWWDAKLCVRRMRDHMMGPGCTPKNTHLLQRVGVLLDKRPAGPPDRHLTQLAFGTFPFCFGQQAVFWCSTFFVKNKQGDCCLSIETIQARRGMPSEAHTRTRTLSNGDILGESHWQSVEFEYNEKTGKKSSHITSLAPTPLFCTLMYSFTAYSPLMAYDACKMFAYKVPLVAR